MNNFPSNGLAANAVALDDFAATVATTGALVVGGTTSGTLEASGDSDWFKISLTAGQAYTLGLEGARSGGGSLGQGTTVPALAIQSPTGNQLATAVSKSVTGDPVMSFIPPTSGDYFVAASANSGTGSYTLRASLAAPDDLAGNKFTSGVIDIGLTLPGTLEQTGDVDWFKITLTKDTNYKFSLSAFKTGGGTLGAGTSPTLVLYAKEGYVLSQADGTLLADPSIWFTSFSSGTYYLAVRDDNTGIGTYNLRAAQGNSEPMVESVSGIPYSGDVRADSLMSGSADWNYLLPARTTLNYTFNPSAMNVDQHKDTANLNASEEVAAIDIMGYVSALTGISFVEVSSAEGADIHFGIDIHPTLTTPTSSIIKQDTVFDTTTRVMTKYNVDAYIYLNSNTLVEIRDNIAKGSFAYEALLREVGRALGLSSPATSGDHAIPAEQNNTDFTVMSGIHAGAYKSTFQADDLLALQWLYGGDGLRGQDGLRSTNGPSLALPDTTPPVVAAAIPVNGALDATADANIVFAFNEEIKKGAGFVTLLNAADGTVVESFAVDSSTRLGWSGSLLIIDPTADLVAGKAYQIQIPSGVVLDLAGNVYAGISNYGFKVSAPVVPTVSYTVSGTLGDDVLVPTAGNSYRGGAGTDVYIIGAATLSGTVTAAIVDTEGSNLIQFADGLVVSASSFYADAAQLSLSTGAVLQILGASKFSFGVGANAAAGDASAILSYAQFASMLGGSLPSGSTPVQGTANFTVPTVYDAAAAPTPAVAGAAVSVSGTLGADVLIASAGNNYLGGGGSDTYIVGRHTLAGPVTASITDTEGSNSIQLVDGTVISSSSFLNDAVQLTLSTGAKVQVLGASKFSFQLGANAPGGDTAASLSYAAFGAALGAVIPAAGGAVASGTADFVVPISVSGGSQLAPQGVEWPALSGISDTATMAWSSESILSLP